MGGFGAAGAGAWIDAAGMTVAVDGAQPASGIVAPRASTAARLTAIFDTWRTPYLPVRSRCLHPGQQQGRRWPSSSSSWVRRMRRSRVGCCLASSTQQMNSLRANGVMSFQAISAVELASSAVRRSAGNSCTTPPGTCLLLTGTG